jgi:hypothetical protein
LAQVPPVQTGAPMVGHARDPPEPKSPLQPAQVLDSGLHAGVVPLQGPQPVHWPFWHKGVLAGQLALLPLPKFPLQATHAPLTHTGKAPLHCAELVHVKQAVALPPGGFGQLPPPFTAEPRQVQGVMLVIVPQASPDFKVVQVPGCSPTTTP